MSEALTTSSAEQTVRAGPTPDWHRIRGEFPATERFVYLDIARKALLPVCVKQAMADWWTDVHERAGETAFSMQEIEETRKTVAGVFGAPPEQLALIKNTSEGLNIVAQGFPWRAGDNVVISELEHENNTFPWRYAAQRHDFEVRVASPDERGRITVERYRDLVDERTRILSVAWVTYGNGYRADLPALSAFCRPRNIKLVVDGIQGVGVLATPLSELGADVLVAGGHKSQFSLAGAGLMYAAPEMIEMLRPSHAAKFSFTSNDRTVLKPTLSRDAHRFEYGNPNFLGVWVQRRSAKFIASIGLNHIEARIRALTTQLIENAARRGFTTHTPLVWSERAGIVAIEVGAALETIVARLKAEQTIVSARDGRLRASLHIYNDEDDIDRFLSQLQEASANSASAR